MAVSKNFGPTQSHLSNLRRFWGIGSVELLKVIGNNDRLGRIYFTDYDPLGVKTKIIPSSEKVQQILPL